MTDFDASRVERIIGYEFSDKSLLAAALTHQSYINEHGARETSYQRLEFLGDAILDFVVAEILYFTSSDDAGKMTKDRIRVVSREPLARAVERLGLLDYVRVGRGAKEEAFKMDKPKSDLFESVLAAIYIDSKKNIDAARKFIQDNLTLNVITGDTKSRLQEYTQKQFSGELPHYETEPKDGENAFVSVVFVGGKKKGIGEGRTKKEAERAAAKEALNSFGV